MTNEDTIRAALDRPDQRMHAYVILEGSSTAKFLPHQLTRRKKKQDDEHSKSLPILFRWVSLGQYQFSRKPRQQALPSERLLESLRSLTLNKAPIRTKSVH